MHDELDIASDIDDGPPRLLFDLLKERLPPSEILEVKRVLGFAAIERNEVRQNLIYICIFHSIHQHDRV
jgi:hypothetical protein